MTSFKPLLSPRGKSGPQFWGRKTKVLLFSLVPLFFSFTAAQAQCDITLTPTNIRSATCGGNEGSFSVTVTGITAPYQYSLEKDINGTFVVQESGTLIAGSPTFVFLTAGTYKVTVSKDGCTNSTTVSIPEESLTLTPANIKHPTCGANDGSFTVTTTGIKAPYQYVLSKLVNGEYVVQENGTLIAGNPTFVFLAAGTYKLDVTKGGTCSGTVSVTLEQEELTLTPANIKHPTCGANDGSFTVTTTGIKAPYQYVLSKLVNGEYVVQENGTLIAGNPTFVFLAAGTYKLDVTKGGTCSGTVSVTLEQEELTLTPANIKHPTCGANDGSFTVTTTGIKAPYQYVLSKLVNGEYVVQENGTLIAGNPTFVFLAAGTYKLDVTKGGTCSGTVSVTLEQEELTLTPANIKHPTCGANDGSFTVTTTGIKAPYQYVLSKLVNGEYVVQENGTLIAGNPTFVFLAAGTYKLDVTKGGTCSGTVSVTLEQEELTTTLTNLTPPSCGGSDGSFQVATTGIKAPYQFKLLREEAGGLTQVQSGTLATGTLGFAGLPEGTYKVEIEKGSNCSGSLTVYLYCEKIGKEGCSPGYWKNAVAGWVTTNYAPAQTVESVFDVPDSYRLDQMTLLEALQGSGGKGTTGAALILLRAATAALLNAAHRDVAHSVTMQYIITQTNAALASGNRKVIEQLANTLDRYNNMNCPLSANSGMSQTAADGQQEVAVAAGLHLKAMPNPSAGEFTVVIGSSASGPFAVRVVDMQGRLVEKREQVPANTTLQMGASYAAGVYMLEVVQGRERKGMKLIKTK